MARAASLGTRRLFSRMATHRHLRVFSLVIAEGFVEKSSIQMITLIGRFCLWQ
jgi:hypothetical protein